MNNYSPVSASPGLGAPAQASGAPASSKDAGLERADGTPVRVLVVDDEPSLAELLASVLRYEGWTVRTAGNGTDAVRTAREFRPDAVVLDIMLPDFNGLEVMRRIRAEIARVCVLFLTARDAVEDRVVRNRTHTCGSSARTRRSTSSPSKSGSMMSSTTASGRNSRATRTAEVPSAAALTSQPS